MAAEEAGSTHHKLDIRDLAGVGALVRAVGPTPIVHTAAQPSHDRAVSITFEEFDANAVGNLNLFEAARQDCPYSPFVHMSTNKVDGDARIGSPLRELPSRWYHAKMSPLTLT